MYNIVSIGISPIMRVKKPVMIVRLLVLRVNQPHYERNITEYGNACTTIKVNKLNLRVTVSL
jgi:hypothetical protein